MRTHNFNYGADPRHYVSTHNATYQEFKPDPNGGKASNEDIRKTHFTLGNESASMMTVH
jgi:hypothetical protein